MGKNPEVRYYSLAQLWRGSPLDKSLVIALVLPYAVAIALACIVALYW